MSNCLIPVTQEYINLLISLLIRHHAYMAKFKFMNELTGINKNNVSSDNLPVLSNIIYFLINWSDSIDCKDVHAAKFLAMSIIGFTESDINDEIVDDALLLEWGYVYLQEIGSIYTQQE